LAFGLPRWSGFVADLIFFHVATSKMEEQDRFSRASALLTMRWNKEFLRYLQQDIEIYYPELARRELA
jgi:hypothetical protein